MNEILHNKFFPTQTTGKYIPWRKFLQYSVFVHQIIEAFTVKNVRPE